MTSTHIVLAITLVLLALLAMRIIYATAWVFLMVIIASLTGCTHAPQHPPVTYRPVVPMALLNCQPNPLVPTGSIKQSDVAQYIVDLWGAGQDCRDKLRAVRIELGGDQALG